MDKRRYQVESFDQYDFNLCQKHSSDKENYYIFKCVEDTVYTSPISNLENSQYRISKKVYSDHFLKDLKDYTLKSLQKNEESILSLVECIDSDTDDCVTKKEELKEYVKSKLPSYRKTLALSNIEILKARGLKFYEVPHEIEHSSLSYEIPNLSKEEHKKAKDIKKEIVYGLEQDTLSQIDHKCITYDYEYKENICPLYIKNKIGNQVSKGINRVKEQYEKEYNKRNDADSLIGRLNLRGDESDSAILSELKKQLSLSVEANREAYRKISKLDSDSELIDLVKNKVAVQGYLKTQGVSKASCDFAQSLYQDVKSDQLMSSLYLGGAAIVGGGICLGTFGVGCAIGVGLVAEATDLYMQQSNLESSRLSYSAGIGTVGDIESAESDRNLALAFVAVGSVGQLANPVLKIAKKSYSSVRKTLDKIPSKNQPSLDLSEIRNYRPVIAREYSSISQLKNKYSLYNLTTPRLNKRWIDTATNSDSSLFLDVENGALKRLNDSIGDKELVTSLTNLHKDILYDRINKLTKKYDGIEFEVYSDFKSLRFAFTPKDIPEDIKNKLIKDLNLTYKNANQEFATKIKNLEGIGKEDPSAWFEGGLGITADAAGQAAKRARAIRNSEVKLTSFNEIKNLVENDVKYIKTYSSTLRESPLYNAKLVDKISNSGARTLKLEVFEAVRKSMGNYSSSDLKELIPANASKSDFEKAASELNGKNIQITLKNKFGVSLSSEESRGLVEYVRQLDGLTPGLRQEARVVATLDNANLGGFSGDITAMGARNIRQVAIDIAQTKSSRPDEILAVTRTGERSVTRKFESIKSNFTTTVKNVFEERKIKYYSKCSGDDCVVVPKVKLKKGDEIAIVNAFRNQDNPSQYRLSFIPPGIDKSKRTLLATHGELIEKELRKQISGLAKDKIPYAKVSKLTMGTRMPSSVNRGDVELYLGVSKNVKLSANEKDLLEKAYKRAVDKINRNLQMESTDSSQFLYDSGGINFIE